MPILNIAIPLGKGPEDFSNSSVPTPCWQTPKFEVEPTFDDSSWYGPLLEPSGLNGNSDNLKKASEPTKQKTEALKVPEINIKFDMNNFTMPKVNV